ncbi:DNA-binding protein YbiB [Undibacterium fentianense]|uniref:DNA-binding protein YbiB n=1 Tax=Undibacterium fentianense TaxID=2828728 RepID=A0A941E250_9BURK|nr:DNA-binding protein YbiB [Undibacterium fentianense]MBR7799586.1 DNA-binding protein YbiB [Undibacterium fentianense]
MKNTQDQLSLQPFIAASYIKEIGRGKDGARDLSRHDARHLYCAMLDGRVNDLEMGGILLAMRIKGESIEEIAGFLDAAHASMPVINAPLNSEYAPIIIPSYNGARKRPNLTPLLAVLLANSGAPVLVHGLTEDPGRVTSAEIFTELQIDAASTVDQVDTKLNTTRLAFMPLKALSPAIYRILMMRRILGVRNSTHTIVKILQPFAQPALRLSSYTHPEYQAMLDCYFQQIAPPEDGAVVLSRGTEGEVVASTGRAQRMDAYFRGQREILLEASSQLIAESVNLPEGVGAEHTARWIKSVLDGKIEIPENIRQQHMLCLALARRVKQCC